MKLLHSNTLIFFSNPYVVRLEYPNVKSLESIQLDYSTLIRKTYKLISGTWGHSPINIEMSDTKFLPKTMFINGVKHPANSVGWTRQSFYSYICFKDEIDALQFLLGIDLPCKRVFMWPSNVIFIIHENIDKE